MIPHDQSVQSVRSVQCVEGRPPEGGAATAPARAPDRRVAILVLGCLMTVYQRCIRGIRATWGATARPNVDVFYVYGGQWAPTSEEMADISQVIGQPAPALPDGAVWVDGDIILCGATDVRDGQPDCILRKRLIAFDHLANRRGYDFVYTVCATSYVDVDRLARYVAGLPASGVYHGALHVHEETGYPFVSGASLLLSRDLARELADSAATILSRYPETLPDDVVIGHFLASRHAAAAPAEIARRIGAGLQATDNQTFVMPFGDGSTDFVMAPAFTHVPNDRGYHYHFNSRRVWEMENFHRRFFSARSR